LKASDLGLQKTQHCRAFAAALIEQRKFIRWWDAPERGKYKGRPEEKRISGDTLLRASDLGLGSAAAARSLLKRLFR
jgi:hypothetical protein